MGLTVAGGRGCGSREDTRAVAGGDCGQQPTRRPAETAMGSLGPRWACQDFSYCFVFPSLLTEAGIKTTLVNAYFL